MRERERDGERETGRDTERERERERERVCVLCGFLHSIPINNA